MMNKRIGELAEQARDYTDSLISSSGWANGDKIFEEKFAELIVRECMSIAGKAASLDAEYEAWYLIKQHFGVE